MVSLCSAPTFSIFLHTAVNSGGPCVPLRGCLRHARCLLRLLRGPLRTCAKKPARVAHNVRLADMNIDVRVSDDRRIEVVAKGLALDGMARRWL